MTWSECKLHWRNCSYKFRPARRVKGCDVPSLFLVGSPILTGRYGYCIEIRNRLRGHTELLFVFLIGYPLEFVCRDHERLRIELRIVDRDRQFQIVMVHTRVAFLYLYFDTMRIFDAEEG